MLQLKEVDPRSGIADARISYGTSGEYESAPRKLLLSYNGGIKEVKGSLSREHS